MKKPKINYFDILATVCLFIWLYVAIFTSDDSIRKSFIASGCLMMAINILYEKGK